MFEDFNDKEKLFCNQKKVVIFFLENKQGQAGKQVGRYAKHTTHSVLTHFPEPNFA